MDEIGDSTNYIISITRKEKMKLTNNDLRRIIKEELNNVMNEYNFDEHNLIHDDGTPFTEQEKEQFEQIDTSK